MKKNKPKPEPKYAPIIAMSPEPRTTVLAKPVKPERQQSQAPDQGAETKITPAAFTDAPNRARSTSARTAATRTRFASAISNAGTKTVLASSQMVVDAKWKN
jgi:hypothetical protein